jgi:hypothetical protein
MPNYAVIENNKVLNVIIADSKEIAEQVTGMTCVESLPENPAVIGLGYTDGVFEQPKPSVIE